MASMPLRDVIGLPSRRKRALWSPDRPERAARGHGTATCKADGAKITTCPSDRGAHLWSRAHRARGAL